MPMAWTKFELPLGGVDTFTDAHHVAPGKMAEVENARFDNPPGINKRYGYTALSKTRLGSTDLSSGSRITDHNGELLVYSGTHVYAYSATPQRWVDRGIVSHAFVERQGVHADPLLSVTAGDIAYNQGVKVVSTNSSYSLTVYDLNDRVLARSVNTVLRGAKLVAVGNFIYAFQNETGSLRYSRIDVTSGNYTFPSVSTVAGVDIETAGAGAGIWDVCGVGSANICVAFEDASDNQVRVSLIETTGNTVVDSELTGETSEQAISVRGSINEQVWVFYGTATPTIRAVAYAVTTTTLTATLAPTTVNTGIATPLTRNIASFRLNATTEGFIWTHINDNSAPIQDMDDVAWNSITTTGTLGTIAIFEDCTLVSRPWGDGSFAVHAAVAFNDLRGEQGTGFIIRWGQHLTGGLDTTPTWVGTFNRDLTDIWTSFFLPNVAQLISTFEFPCLVKQRFINADTNDKTVIARNIDTITSANNALDIVTVDYLDAERFMSAAWGPGLFIAGARPGWYDGATIVEHGFAWRPTLNDADLSGSAGTGQGAGVYQAYLVYEFLDRNNMMTRSAPSAVATVTVAVVFGGFDFVLRHDLTLTSRTAAAGTAATPQVLPYRTVQDGTIAFRAVPFSGFSVANATKSITSTTPHGEDSVIERREVLYTTGDILDNAGTPPCKFTLRHQDRLWMAGMENPNTIWFSQPFVETEAPRFSEALILDIGERVTALGSMDEKLIVFSETRVYQVVGNGPPASGGVDIGFAVDLVTGDTGCIESRSVVTTPRGLMFRGHKGFYMLTRGGELAYVGAPVQALARQFTSTTSAVLLSLKNEVRFTVDDQEDGRILHYNYFLDQWSVDIIATQAVSACLTSNLYAYLTSGGQTYVENPASFTDPDSAFIPLSVTTPWIAMDTKQGWQRCRSVTILGRNMGAHGLLVEIGYDYADTFSQTATVTAAQVAALSREQVTVRFARQKCQAFRVRITDTTGADVTEGLNLTSLVFEIGLKKGVAKLLAAEKF